MTIQIIGAGMAGLLAANMLQRHKPVVLEAAPALPNNHSAVLRFRTRSVADVLGIPFKKVSVIKDALPWMNPVADALAYSAKNTGVMRSDRSITSGLTVAERYIAPHDLIEQMAAGLDVRFGLAWQPQGLNFTKPVTISTIPMPSLMTLLGYDPPFDMAWSPAINVTAKVSNCDAYVSMAVPDPRIKFSRISLTGDELIVEVPGHGSFPIEAVGRGAAQSWAAQAAVLLGIDPGDLCDVRMHQAQYAKILPVPDDLRREFIYEASVKHNIYSLGRFATWRPGLLLDDLVQDVRKIEGWLSGRRNYEMAHAK